MGNPKFQHVCCNYGTRTPGMPPISSLLAIKMVLAKVTTALTDVVERTDISENPNCACFASWWNLHCKHETCVEAILREDLGLVGGRLFVSEVARGLNSAHLVNEEFFLGVFFSGGGFCCSLLVDLVVDRLLVHVQPENAV